MATRLLDAVNIRNPTKMGCQCHATAQRKIEAMMGVNSVVTAGTVLCHAKTRTNWYIHFYMVHVNLLNIVELES